MNRLRSSQLLRINEHVQEYVRRIYQANGVPSEQATDDADADASPRTRALAPIAQRAAIAAARARQNVNQSVYLLP